MEVRINCKCKENTFKFPVMKVKHFFLVVSICLFRRSFFSLGKQPRKPNKDGLVQTRIAVISVMA